MRLRARAAFAVLIGGSITVVGCGKSETDVEIPSLNDPVTIGDSHEVSTDTLDANDPIGGLPSLPSGTQTKPLDIPATTPSQTP